MEQEASDQEIVTPEMIEAGQNVYWARNPEYDLSSEIVRDIWLAMETARLNRRGETT